MFEPDLLLRVQGRQVIEKDFVFCNLRILEIDRLDFQQREIPLALLGRPNLPRYRISVFQIEPLDLRRADIYIIRAR